MNKKMWIAYFVVFTLVGFARLGAAESVPVDPTHIVAIENVCVWPNLTLMPDGSIIAIVQNKPSHGGMEGEIECWVSADGERWEKRGVHPSG